MQILNQSFKSNKKINSNMISASSFLIENVQKFTSFLDYILLELSGHLKKELKNGIDNIMNNVAYIYKGL